MSTKIVVIVVAIAIFIASWFVESRLAPPIGALLLLGAIIYGMVANKRAGKENYRKAERATREQNEKSYHQD